MERKESLSITMEHRKKKLLKTFCLVYALTIIMIFLYPVLFEYQCRTRNFYDFEDKIIDNIMSSNIVIVEHEEKIESENVVHSTYGTGASGVVFKKDKDTYYALTAYHVVNNYPDAEYFIIPYGAPTYSEYRSQSDVHVANEEYYGQFEKASVVFADEKYDLAVISFKSKELLNVLSIEESNPKYNERIAVVSDPEGERFLTAFGVIRSKDYYTFESDDRFLSVNTFKHNAYINSGSSGSAVLDQDMNIVGINIGGGTNFLHKFVYGAMVPCELIIDFLVENNFSYK